MVGSRRGQVLLIAVLLMMVVLLVGILFVALVTRNQQQSARHLDVVTAQALAEAGIRYADTMLQTSPQGADWRPRFVAHDPATYDADDPSTWPSPPAMYEDGSVDPRFYGADGVPDTEDDYYSDFDIIRGWCPLRTKDTDGDPYEFVRHGYHRYPDPYPGAAAGAGQNSVTWGRGYVLLRVTYDPDPPFEPGDGTEQVNLSNCIRIESIGRVSDESTVFRRLVAYKPIGLTDHLRWITNRSKTGKPAYLGVRPEIDFDGDGTAGANEALVSVLGGPVRSDTGLRLVAKPVSDGSSTWRSVVFDLQTEPSSEGYLRDDALQATEGLYTMDYVADGVGVITDGGAEELLETQLAPADTSAIARVMTGHRDVPPLEAPDIAATDPTTGLDRYRALTRDSGSLVCNDSTAGTVVNTGKYGHGAGVYIDNFADVQFMESDGTCDLSLLAQDWRKEPRSLGVLTGDSGWNALGTTYTPPAVEIELFPSQAAVLATCSSGTSSDTAPTDPGVLWWPNHVAGEPGIKITRHDRRWGLGDPGSPGTVGDDSGENVMVIDYPQYPSQVIFAEGNVRVKGVLPAGVRNASDMLVRDYNMTIVSSATIYIDGQILSPQDVDDSVSDENNTGVALLAKDYVCLNPTQLVPQLTSGLVPAAPDDEMAPELGQHWELDSDTGGSAYSYWYLGQDLPDTDSDGTPDTNLYLTVVQAGGSPGPSGVGLSLSEAGTISAHSFGNPVSPSTFIFAPEGALLWGSVTVPNSYTSTAIAPQWQPTPWDFAGPRVLWDITGSVSDSCGVRSALGLYHRDPQLGTPASEYWVKKWKIEELETFTDSGTDYGCPRGAIKGKVNALIYAQRGSWFVIPGDYFDPNARAQDFNGDGSISIAERLWGVRMRRYNYNITVCGCITEDHTAEIEDAQDWSNKWAYPRYGSATTLDWGTVEYQFDERLRVARDQGTTSLSGGVRSSSVRPYTPQANLPKLPLLPVSPTLLYYGEAF